MSKSNSRIPAKSRPELTRRQFLRDTAAAASLARIATARFASALAPEPVILEGRCESMDEYLGLQLKSPRLSWRPLASVAWKTQTAYRVTVSSRPGGKADLWDSGRVSSSQTSTLYGGKLLAAHDQAYWQVETWTSEGQRAESPLQRWSAGPAGEAQWKPSRWIGLNDILEDTQEKMAGSATPPPEPPHYPAPYLRKQFHLAKRPSSALLYVAVGGFAETYVNGVKLGGALERAPGFTNYQRRVEYVTFDVTEHLVAGENALGVILGTGWFDVHDVATWHFDTSPWRQRPRARVLLVVRDLHGVSLHVVSDDSWMATAGPILRDGIYTGEVYDARLEMPNWNTATYDASRWRRALLVDAPNGELVPVSCPPVRITDTVIPVRMTEPRPGVFLFDMGQSFAGHAQLRVRADSGHVITVRYGEMLDVQGSLDTHELDKYMMTTIPRQPFQQDTYICKGGDAEEVWEQRFSYAGFRYVEVANYPGRPTFDSIRGRVAHADLRNAGEFRCSSEITNAIQQATLWSYLSNAQSHPTDCPQREKNGWTADAALAVDCGLLNFQSEAFYRKWLRDFADAQGADGRIPVIIPTSGWGDGRSWPGNICPPWDVSYVIIAWTVYRFTGDASVLAEHVESLKRYLDYFLGFRSSSGLVLGLGLGDWVPWKTVTPLDYVSNIYLFLNLDLMHKICAMLGDQTSSQRYAGMAKDLAVRMQEHFYHPETGCYANGSQTAQSLALCFGLVSAKEKKAVETALIKNVEQLGHLDVGVLGAKFLLRALSEAGRTDLAYRIATQPTLPSWGHWIAQGATTLWEDWRGESSRNHIMFGDVSAWFYEWIAGIQQASGSVGFDRIRFCPNPVADLTYAEASHLSPLGPVHISWTFQSNRLQFQCMVPAGATAELVLPAKMSLRFVDGVERGGLSCFFGTGKHKVEAMADSR